jgi:hypothetical protein
MNSLLVGHCTGTLFVIGCWLFVTGSWAASNHHQQLTTNNQQLAVIALSAADRQAASPDMAVGPDGSLNALWVDRGPAQAAPTGRPPGGHSHKTYTNLLFARSTDQGATFSPPVRVNSVEGSVWGFATSKPRIGVGKSGTIHVYYSGNRRPPTAERQAVDAMYSRSTDSGRTFEPPRMLNKEERGEYDDGELNEAHCFGTMGVAPDGSVHVFWIDTRHIKKEGANGSIYGAVSRDDGKTFETERVITRDDTCPCCQLHASFAPDGALYLTWRRVYEDGARNSTVAWSKDSGKTFSPPVSVSANKWMINGCPLKPTITTVGKGGRVYATWYAGEEDPAGVYFSYSEDGGKTFSKPQPMQSEAKVSDHSQVALGRGGNVYVAWDARVGEDRRVYVRASADYGKTFGPVTELGAGSSTYPAIVVGKDGRPFVAWQQDNRVMFQVLSTAVAQKR